MYGCVLGHDKCLELQTSQEQALITVNVFFINCETNGCYSKEINGVCVRVCMETFSKSYSPQDQIFLSCRLALEDLS